MEMFLVALLVTTGICHVTTAPSPHSKLEDFLYRYGYLPATDRENGVKRSETDLEQATMRLQKFGGLNITGKLDQATLKLIGTPRCGMPDMVVKNDDILGVVQVNDGPSNYSVWKPWKSFPVTYGFINYTPDLTQSVVDRVIDESIKLWTDASGLTCSKVSDANTAVMKIMFGAKSHDSCGSTFDGPNGVLAHAYFPDCDGICGDLHFDEDETWTDGTYSGVNLKWVAIHEFGHAIGIKHSDVLAAIMYPYYTGYTPNPQLHADDIAAARALYGDYVDECGTTLGYEPKSRGHVDTDQMQLMVSKASFSSSGEVRSIKVYSRNAGRRVRVGIYRPSGGAGTFTLVKVKDFASIPVGYNELSLSGSDVLQVQAGDSFGFVWLDYGVIEFDFVSTYNFYDNWVNPNVGDQVSLNGGRYGDREYSIQLCLKPGACVEQSLGYPAISRGHVDTDRLQTMVSKASFSSNGQITTVRVYSRYSGRRFRVGIYRPTGTVGQFTLMQQKEWSSIAVGNTELTLSGNDVFQVQAGDSFGFTWLDYGVAEFDFVSTYNFYDNWLDLKVGDIATLDGARYGDREYSVRLEGNCG